MTSPETYPKGKLSTSPVEGTYDNTLNYEYELDVPIPGQELLDSTEIAKSEFTAEEIAVEALRKVLGR